MFLLKFHSRIKHSRVMCKNTSTYLLARFNCNYIAGIPHNQKCISLHYENYKENIFNTVFPLVTNDRLLRSLRQELYAAAQRDQPHGIWCDGILCENVLLNSQKGSNDRLQPTKIPDLRVFLVTDFGTNLSVPLSTCRLAGCEVADEDCLIETTSICVFIVA
jgi:hypothetical protein